jgi:hypothetical protein
MRWAGLVVGLEVSRGEYSVFVEKPEGRRTFVRPRHRRDNESKMDIKEIRLRIETSTLALRTR